jgi:transcriptional regulator with XRE-family HTH domain
MNGRERLAINVRRLRTERSLTQEKLAIDAGVAAPYLSRIEHGLVNPTVDILDLLAGALGVPVDALLSAPEPGQSNPKTLKAGRKPKGKR